MKLDGYQVNADFSVYAGGVPVIVTGYDRSLQVLKGFGGTLNCSNGTLYLEDEEMADGLPHRGSIAGQQYSCYFSPIQSGKEKFYHMVALNSSLRGEQKEGNGRFLTTKKGAADDFYNYLMKNYSLPLMKRWAGALYVCCKRNGYLVDDTHVHVAKYSPTMVIPLGEETVPLSEVVVVSVSSLSDQRLRKIVKQLFDECEIWISREQQKKLEFETMDQYFERYGAKLVENLKTQIVPLTELDGGVKDFTLKHLWMYPQQAAQVNGGLALLDKSRYMIMNHGMGTGKTLCGAGLCEGYFGRKWLKSHPDKTLKDLYLNPENLNYRNIVMAPGHLVKKWAREIEENVPYAQVEILDDFSKLLKLKKRGRSRKGREWFVISKDFGKLSYQEKPAPIKVRKKPVYTKKCRKCMSDIDTTRNYCTKCEEEVSVVYQRTGELRTGMICPDCGRLLFSSVGQVKVTPDIDEDEKTRLLLPADFATHTSSNDACFYCGAKLWTPNVNNLGGADGQLWKRVTAWSNKAHRGKKTLWIHKDFIPETIKQLKLEVLDIKEARGVRKFSPTLFIKKYMRGFFDIAVFDEAHMYKGGGTGQGHAMHCLVKASKKQLALTGTIAGGYANHLFYLLWRLEPQRMVKKGYTFHSEMKFCEDYGCVERSFAVSESGDGIYNTSCRGKQLGSPRVRPGISPLIFMDYLLDRCTFLDLSDMSKYLPTLKESVIEVSPKGTAEEQVFTNYKGVCQKLMEMSKTKGGRGILGTAIQFGLSFMDKPYGVSPIKSPYDGSELVEAPNDETLEGEILSKEKALVDLMKRELGEGRNCVVYAEYTASPETCISYRLKTIIEKECGLSEEEVVVLESASPVPAKREEWMHKKAGDGAKVFITNPKCVETGLDFCWSENGVDYNYPTLIFYQMGSSMFTISQAARRHYRLNQRRECRTYYMAWSGTPQAAMIQLIAKKQVATSAIQGKFSTEGLAAMAAGVDTRVQLAAAMSGKDTKTKNDLQAMFDVLNETEESGELDGTERMLLLHELLGDDAPSQRTLEEMEQHDSFDLFELLFQDQEEQKKSGGLEKKQEEPARTSATIMTDKEEMSNMDFTCVMMDISGLSKKKRIKASGQFAIMW